jgi:hypothetical protein
MDTKPTNPSDELSEEASEFYRRTMRTLQEKNLPFLVGGAYAFARYTGIVRHTKDFDIFVDPDDFDRILDTLAETGCHTERNFPHWLGKAYHGDDFVDVIFSSGNGVARVDRRWFEQSVEETVLGIPVRLVPAEEMIWSKSFIMERERFDGADVVHLLYARAEDLDWDRLLERFGDDWRVLYSHLTLFGYIYPGERHRIPAAVMRQLTERLLAELDSPATGAERKLCQGTILSRSQYLNDLERWRLRDARLEPVGHMSSEEIEIWTTAAKEQEAEAMAAEKK